MLALYGVYLCASRFVSRRAGVLSALVLATSPLYSLVARQAMTDMAFVGPMTLALALGALALFDDDDPSCRAGDASERSCRWPHHPLFYLAIGLFVVTAAAPAASSTRCQLDAGPLREARLAIPGCGA